MQVIEEDDDDLDLEAGVLTFRVPRKVEDSEQKERNKKSLLHVKSNPIIYINNNFVYKQIHSAPS